MKLDAKIPGGPIETKWSRYKGEMKLINPANKRKYNIIVVGTGLAGASAAASLAELGYNVKNFCIQDSPRRAHARIRLPCERRRGALSPGRTPPSKPWCSRLPMQL